jgi:hypothetical protein
MGANAPSQTTFAEEGIAMGRKLVAGSLTFIAVVVTASVASADQACPVGTSGWQLYPIVGETGDPVQEPGQDPLWDTFVAAVGDEGLTVEELAVSLGFGGVDALYSFVLEEVHSIDLNANRQVCVKPFPEPGQGHPGWVHNFIDDRVRSAL